MSINLGPRKRLEIARRLCRLLDDKLATQITLLRVPEYNSLADCFIVATATGNTHIEALVDSVEDCLRDEGFHLYRPVEGRNGSTWRVVDGGFIVLHLMDETARAKYHLQDLWSDSKKIKWEIPRQSKKSSKR